MNGAPDTQRKLSRMEQLTGRKNLRNIAEFLVVAICTLAFVFTAMDIGMVVLGRSAVGTRDFVEYWASAQQLAHRANPYDGRALLPIERSVGLPSDMPPMVMGNAPPALALVFPLGFLGPRSAEVLWSLLLLACLIASVRMVWAMHGKPRNHLQVLGYGFAPALACLGAGQMSLLVLFGLVLFLRFRQTSPFMAGASLWFCALKPQLFLPFGLVLLAWIVASKCYRLLAGAVSALAFSTAVAFILDPRAWTQYHQMMNVARYDKFTIPCFSIILRRTISPGTMWLQYLPAVIGCVWAIAYFRRHRNEWDWIAHGSILILFSVLVAPYTWLIDQCIVIPALLHGVFITRSRKLVALLAMASAIIEIAPLRGMELLHSAFYVWTAPTWLVWYLYASRPVRSESERAPSQSIDTASTSTGGTPLCAVGQLSSLR
jgi:Glycosyltransferase family 87